MADHVRVGADGVQAQEPLAGHALDAGGEEVLGPREGVLHAPPLVVGQELVAPLAVELGVFDLGLAELLVVPHDVHQVHGAADAVFGEEHGQAVAVRASAACG